MDTQMSLRAKPLCPVAGLEDRCPIRAQKSLWLGPLRPSGGEDVTSSLSIEKVVQQISAQLTGRPRAPVSPTVQACLEKRKAVQSRRERRKAVQ